MSKNLQLQSKALNERKATRRRQATDKNEAPKFTDRMLQELQMKAYVSSARGQEPR